MKSTRVWNASWAPPVNLRLNCIIAQAGQSAGWALYAVPSTISRQIQQHRGPPPRAAAATAMVVAAVVAATVTTSIETESRMA